MSGVEEDSNPFEGAFAMIKEMRLQVHKMQASLDAERRDRESEVGRLRQDVENLKARLAQETTEKTALCHKLGEGLVEAKARHSRQNEDFTTFVKTESAKMAEDLAGEARARKAALQALADKLAGEAARLGTDCATLRQDVAELYNAHQAASAESRRCFGEHSQSIERIAGVLRNIGASWNSVKDFAVVATSPPQRSASPGLSASPSRVALGAPTASATAARRPSSAAAQGGSRWRNGASASEQQGWGSFVRDDCGAGSELLDISLEGAGAGGLRTM